METGEFIAPVELGLQTEQLVLLVSYLSGGQIPAADEFVAQWDELLIGHSEIGEYSVDLIEIVEEKDDPAAKDALADNLASLNTGLLALPSFASLVFRVDAGFCLLSSECKS